MLLNSWLKNLTARIGRAPARPVRRRHAYRIMLEPLESRLAPAIHTWIGPNGGVWSAATNWAGGFAPNAGEVGAQLIFNSDVTSIGNIAGLVVDSIAFNADHNVILTAPLGLNGVVDFPQIEATSSTAVFSGAAISLIGPSTPALNTGSSGTIMIQSDLTGPSGIRTIGNGTVILQGSATYAGSTNVTSGVLQLKNSANANNTLPPSLINVGDASGASLSAELRVSSNNQIADAAAIVVNSDGHITLNGKSEGVGLLTLLGGQITTGSGVLTLLQSVNVGAIANSSIILGNVDLGPSDRTFFVDNGSADRELVINGTISGSGDLILNGPGTLEIAGASGSPNTYTGVTSVISGTLLLNAGGVDEAIPGALFIGGADGSAVVRLLRDSQIKNRVTLNNDGLLDLNGFTDTIGDLTLMGGDITTGAAGSLHLSGTTLLPAFNTASTTITGNLVLAASGADNTFTVHNGDSASDLIIDGVISGSGGLIKAGAGTLEIGGGPLTPTPAPRRSTMAYWCCQNSE